MFGGQVDGEEMEYSRGGSLPTVGILFPYHPPDEIAAALKRKHPEIRIVLVSLGTDEPTEEEREKLHSLEILLMQQVVIEKFDIVHNLPKLKWMHSFGAGVDMITNAVKRDQRLPAFTLTRNVSYFDLQMAEYVMGMILSRERLIPELLTNQANGKRDKIFGKFRPLSELSLGICGFGSIGKEVARLAKAFRLKIWALVQSLPTESSRSSVVDEYRLLDELGDLLSSCDYIVSVLPNTPATNGFFDGEILSHCKQKKSAFMNIGRGNVVSESTILNALKRGWIGHAILDVFDGEPLPLESPLWTHPEVTITPHTSGTSIQPDLFVKTAVENYERYIKGEPLLYTVDWHKGY